MDYRSSVRIILFGIGESLCQAVDGLLERFRLFDFAFPNGECLPAELFEVFSVKFVAGCVALEFGQPEIAAVGGSGAVFAAAVAMPEAAVDEDGGFVFGEDNVGVPGKVFGVEAKAVAHFVEDGADDDLGPGVFAFDPAHVP
jgi:hypothetical protein